VASSKRLKEISLFTMLSLREIQQFQEFIKPKEAFYGNEELHLIKITKSNYDYCFCNFANSNISINKENPMLENYAKTFKALELTLFDIVNKIMTHIGVNPEEINSMNCLSLKGTFSADIEQYFFDVFGKGMLHFGNNENKEAMRELMISKYLYEAIIFLRIILNNKLETISFLKVFEYIENDDEINLFSEIKRKNKNWQVNFDNLIIFNFIGGNIKTFKLDKVIESEITSDTMIANSNNSMDSLIKFYAEIIKAVLECSKQIE
jgi:hypothetical protein